MIGLITAVHVLIAIVLILIVLLQNAKGTDVGSAFGGMGSQATFGPRGTATFLSKATVGLAVAFMITSVSLSMLASRGGSGGSSVLGSDENVPAAGHPAPASPAAPASSPEPAPGVQVQMPGMEGVRATITVEDPGGEAPDPNTPAATVETGPGTPAAPAQQPAPGTP